MMSNRLLATAMLAAAAMPGLASASWSPSEYRDAPARRNGYRKGRRFDSHGFPIAKPGQHNPAGTKLAKQAAKGILTKSRIR